MKVLIARLRLTLCDPMDCSPLGSSVHGMSRQEYWSGWLFPSPEDFPNPGVQPRSPTLQADSLPAEPNIATIKLRKYSKIMTTVNAE